MRLLLERGRDGRRVLVVLLVVEWVVGVRVAVLLLLTLLPRRVLLRRSRDLVLRRRRSSSSGGSERNRLCDFLLFRLGSRCALLLLRPAVSVLAPSITTASTAASSLVPTLTGRARSQGGQRLGSGDVVDLVREVAPRRGAPDRARRGVIGPGRLLRRVVGAEPSIYLRVFCFSI